MMFVRTIKTFKGKSIDTEVYQRTWDDKEDVKYVAAIYQKTDSYRLVAEHEYDSVTDAYDLASSVIVENKDD